MAERVTYRGRRLHHGHELRRLKAHWEGVDDATLAAARSSENTACVDCGDTPLQGGLRCLPCFQAVSLRKPATGCGTDAGYTSHRRRLEEPCQACREAHNTAQAARRRAAA